MDKSRDCEQRTKSILATKKKMSFDEPSWKCNLYDGRANNVRINFYNFSFITD